MGNIFFGFNMSSLQVIGCLRLRSDDRDVPCTSRFKWSLRKKTLRNERSSFKHLANTPNCHPIKDQRRSNSLLLMLLLWGDSNPPVSNFSFTLYFLMLYQRQIKLVSSKKNHVQVRTLALFLIENKINSACTSKWVHKTNTITLATGYSNADSQRDDVQFQTPR